MIRNMCSPRNFLMICLQIFREKSKGSTPLLRHWKYAERSLRRDTQEFHCLQESKPDGQRLPRYIHNRKHGTAEKVKGLFRGAFGCGYENISRQPGHPAILQAVKGQGDEPRQELIKFEFIHSFFILIMILLLSRMMSVDFYNKEIYNMLYFEQHVRNSREIYCLKPIGVFLHRTRRNNIE